MFKRLLRLSLVCVAGTIIVAANPRTAKAYEEAVAGFSQDKISGFVTISGASDNNISIDIPIPGFTNIGIANVDTNLLIRSGAGENYKILGKIPKDGGCDVVEDSKDGWTKISAKTASGKTIEGYVKSEYLITGAEATQKAKEVGNFVATSNANGLRVRKGPSVNDSIIDTIADGEELIVLDSKIITNDPEYPVWVKVSLDSDSEEGAVAYVYKEYVDISFQLIHALSNDEINYGSGVSQKRIGMINFAKQYLGNRYRYGGTSLTNGIDCSAFMQAIYKNAGISIPRDSRSQASALKSISSSELKPGDLVFYGSKSYINHVAMYIGNGKVIHASNKRDGIKISNMRYRTPVKYGRSSRLSD